VKGGPGANPMFSGSLPYASLNRIFKRPRVSRVFLGFEEGAAWAQDLEPNKLQHGRLQKKSEP